MARDFAMETDDDEAPPPERSEREWRSMIERNASKLRTFVRLQAGHALRSREPVEDLVQSIVRELLTDGESAAREGEPAFRSYMYAVAHNKIVSKQRYHDAAIRASDRVKHL